MLSKGLVMILVVLKWRDISMRTWWCKKFCFWSVTHVLIQTQIIFVIDNRFDTSELHDIYVQTSYTRTSTIFSLCWWNVTHILILNSKRFTDLTHLCYLTLVHAPDAHVLQIHLYDLYSLLLECNTCPGSKLKLDSRSNTPVVHDSSE